MATRQRLKDKLTKKASLAPTAPNISDRAISQAMYRLLALDAKTRGMTIPEHIENGGPEELMQFHLVTKNDPPESATI